MRKKILSTLILVITLISIIIIFLISKRKYDINAQISSYNLQSYEQENEYMNFIKKQIKPVGLQKFIDNDFVPTSLLDGTDTGKNMKEMMEFIGYKMLFMSMFDKTRTNFDDCPVTEKFKEKFNTNLLEYFNLIASEDCESNCLLNREKQEITVEVYGNFENTEPTYQNTHHFHYTLDSDGNVDDVVFDYTEE